MEWTLWKKKDDHPVHTIPNHHPTKLDVLPQLLFKSSLLLNVRPPNNSDDLYLLLRFYPSSMLHKLAHTVHTNNNLTYQHNCFNIFGNSSLFIINKIIMQTLTSTKDFCEFTESLAIYCFPGFSSYPDSVELTERGSGQGSVININVNKQIIRF